MPLPKSVSRLGFSRNCENEPDAVGNGSSVRRSGGEGGSGLALGGNGSQPCGGLPEHEAHFVATVYSLGSDTRAGRGSEFSFSLDGRLGRRLSARAAFPTKFRPDVVAAMARARP